MADLHRAVEKKRAVGGGGAPLGSATRPLVCTFLVDKARRDSKRVKTLTPECMVDEIDVHGLRHIEQHCTVHKS